MTIKFRKKYVRRGKQLIKPKVIVYKVYDTPAIKILDEWWENQVLKDLIIFAQS